MNSRHRPEPGKPLAADSRPRRALLSDSGLLPERVSEVGLIAEDDGWHAYCELECSLGYVDSALSLEVRASDSPADRRDRLVRWMVAQWGFNARDANTAATRLLAGLAEPQADADAEADADA